MPDAVTDKAVIKATVEIVVRDFELQQMEKQDSMTEEELLAVLADQIEYMLEYRMKHLFSLLYRMDVKEELVRAALAPAAPEPGNIGIARLVIQRQKQRNYTKATIATKTDALDEDWKW